MDSAQAAAIANWIPLTSAFAIAIFITKEIYEFFKRMVDEKKKMGACLSVLDREFCKNYRSSLELIDESSHIVAYSTGELILESGEEMNIKFEDKHGKLLFSAEVWRGDDIGGMYMGEVPQIDFKVYDSIIMSISELSSKNYALLCEYYNFMKDVDDYRRYLILYIDGSVLGRNPVVTEDFISELRKNIKGRLRLIEKTYGIIFDKNLKEP